MSSAERLISDPKLEDQRVFDKEQGWIPDTRKERASAELLQNEFPDIAERMVQFYGDQLNNVWRWKGGKDWLVNDGERTVSADWHMSSMTPQQEKPSEPLKLVS